MRFWRSCSVRQPPNKFRFQTPTRFYSLIVDEGFSPGLHPYPNGHPYSAQRQNGDIISVYYRAADPKDYRRTLVEAVIWKLPPQ
ncbi:MAG: hypothetical protein AB1898_29465 [Acidobacteriota bacterium]